MWGLLVPITRKQLAEECSALAFYGIRPNPKAAEAFYRAMVEWFHQLGYPPTMAGVGGPGFGDRMGSFRGANAKLQKRGFRKVRSFDLEATFPDDPRSDRRDYHVAAHYNAERDSLSADVIARSSLATLSAKSLLPIARAMVRELKPDYGFGFTREYQWEPAFYVLGINTEYYANGSFHQAVEDDDEAGQNAEWSLTGMSEQVYRKGILRDIYRWNFLTRPQLKRRVGKSTLERWIRQDPRRGALGAFEGNMVLWEVNKRNIPGIRTALRQAGAILESSEEEDDYESTWTPEESLAWVLGDRPEDFTVFDGTGKEVPTEEVKKIVKRGRKKLSQKKGRSGRA